MLAPIVRAIEVVEPGTTAALHDPLGATAKHRALPGEMLRVGIGALVALSGLAVMETLHVTVVV